jgi:anaerobic selenocysteine-containing dehydrogenase
VEELRKTLCNRDCPDACAIVATVEGGRVTRLAGDPDHPVTRGFLCHRTGRFLESQYGPDRLTTPLLRKGGELVPVSWEEALDFAAARLLAIRRESGPAAILHYRSGGSLGLLLSVVDWFFERFGPVTIKRGDICSGAGEAAQLADLGESDSHDLHDLLNARSVILWGKNVFTSSPHTIPVLREARDRGAGLVLVDPVHHKTASLCHDHVQPRPGGDLSLALAVARILFERGWIDPRAEETCRDLDGFRALAHRRSVEAFCADADVSPAAALDLARRLGPGAPAAILVGWGMQRRRNGAAIVRALDALGAISGNLGVPGGGVSFYFKRRGAFDTSFVRGIEAAPRTVREALLGQDVLDAADPPIRAVWITAANPVAMLPDARRVAEALSTRELVVAVDPFVTDTTRLAHLVLPTTTLLEADDLLGAYGHHTIGVATPVVPAPPGVKSDLEIVQALAARVGLGDELAGDARAWKRRLVEPRLGPAGVTLEDLEAGPVRNPLAPRVLFEGGRFPTASGKVHLMTETPEAPPEAGPDWPMTLLSVSTERSQSSQWARPPEAPLVVTVHPFAAAGIPDGGLGRLESRLGSIPVRVRHDPRQRRDVALVPKGGHLSRDMCANALVRAELTDLGEGAAYYDEPVRLVPA